MICSRACALSQMASPLHASALRALGEDAGLYEGPGATSAGFASTALVHRKRSQMDASPIMTDSPRHLGTARSYDDLHRILRDRAEELDVSRQEIDSASGLQDGYTSKILSPRPTKKLGAISMGLMLETLGLALIVVEDPVAIERTTRKLAKREVRAPIRAAKTGRGHARLVSLRHMRKIAKLGGIARQAAMTPKQRSAQARKAVRKRWAGPRLVEVTAPPSKTTKRSR
jgi:hypothetical protein